MAVYKITSDNAVYQSIEALKYNRNKRHRRRAFFVEGVRNIDAAARYGWRFEAFLYDGSATLSKWARGVIESHREVDLYELTPDLMKELSSKTDTSELAAIVKMRDDAANAFSIGGEASENPIFVLFDRPSGKGNLGTLMRSCDAFGVSALFRTGHSVDYYDPEVIASSAGSFFATPFYALQQNSDIDGLITLLRQSYRNLLVAGSSARGERYVQEADLAGPLLLLIGNEADGLSWRLKHMADIIVAIPMARAAFASSLNVGCAATTLLYEASRQRREAGRS